MGKTRQMIVIVPTRLACRIALGLALGVGLGGGEVGVGIGVGEERVGYAECKESQFYRLPFRQAVASMY